MPDSLKARALEMAYVPYSRRREPFAKSAYEYFGMRDALSKMRGLKADELSQAIRHHLSTGWSFESETDPELWGLPQYLFVQTMLNEHASALATSAKDAEAVERLTNLSRIARELVTLKPVM